jgi:hypothetical protein
LRFDYTTIGHVTVDVLEDGSRRVGGSAFYSALQAARLGRRTLIVTRGLVSEIEQLLEPYRDELELQVQPAPQTTTLRTAGAGARRSQQLLAWAGPVSAPPLLDTAILHFAPVARESPGHWHGQADFVGLTPQGLAREWSADGRQIEPTPPTAEAAAIAASCDAVVINEHERDSCGGLIAAAGAAGAVVAITAGAHPNTILVPGRQALTLDVPTLDRPIDDLGAGDVFAAAFFIALSEERSAPEAAGFANAAAAVRMSGAGSDAIGELAAIEARLSRVAPAR